MNTKQATETATGITIASSRNNTLRILPRKRRPRAAGEVSITCPTSCVYLNGELQQDVPGNANNVEKLLYQNTKAKQEEASNILLPPRCSLNAFKQAEVKKETCLRNAQKQQQQSREKHRIYMTFIRATIAEVDETRESMMMSTFIGALTVKTL